MAQRHCRTLRLVLGDQLSSHLSSLRDHDAGTDLVLMAEVHAEATYVAHHVQKIALVFSAMRHFAAELRQHGIDVEYVCIDDPDSSGSLEGEVRRLLERMPLDRVVVTEPGEWRLRQEMNGWPQRLGVPVEIREDDRFLCSHAEFTAWLRGRKSPRMEHFYRAMRRRTGWLMRDGQPEGGAWNYDPENRKPLPASVDVPSRPVFEPDADTRQVLQLVADRYGHHFGSLEQFGWAVTRDQALQVLADFIDSRLPYFGDYQDAMRSGEDFLFHALLSPYLNIGLLQPREVCEAVLSAYAAGRAPLAACEGFLRQILGWREYVRGLYWAWMPEYAGRNYLQAGRPLPGFFWGGACELNCVREVVQATYRNAYAHHIQRLMIIGNFALLAGLDPAAVNEWYLIVYADAFEWVELPNTHGMALFADGGMLASKPYAASAAYIQRMSDYCSGCRYDPKQKSGPDACPFNYLYWDFLDRNEARLGNVARLRMPYRTLQRMAPARRRQIAADAAAFLDSLSAPAPASD